MMIMKINLLFLSFMIFVLDRYSVSGDNPLQTILSTLECFKTTQVGCNEEFTDVHPELSRSYDNSTKASTRFYLFTPKNVEEPELMHKCGGGLPPHSNFNPKCKTFIVFPGFVSGICHVGLYKQLVYERMKCGCYNYLHIEWTWGNSFDLETATQNMKITAKQAVVVIRGLKKKFKLAAADFLCMGHSLGSHGCGFIGQQEPISAIHGIEPAGAVYWENMPLDERLDPGDAPCVQVTHCNAGQCLPEYFGVNFTCGTKDFWFNDGLHQPGCYKQMFISFLEGDFLYALVSLLPAACNHIQCLQYYRTSMCSDDCTFVGIECKNTEDFLRGKCKDCGHNGSKCDISGFDSCSCGNGNYKNYFLKGAFDCPFCDSKGIRNVEPVKARCMQKHHHFFRKK